MKGPPMGAHVSAGGGLCQAIRRGEELGCDTIQVFVKNPNRWQGPPLSGAEATAFRKAHVASPIGPLFAHTSYLINLAAPNPQNLERSRQALGEELDRCARLGISGLVLHPGAHLESDADAALDRVAESLSVVLGQRTDCPTRILLENTAGQGTYLGKTLEELTLMIERTTCGERLGICIDTCHAFAAGYPIHRTDGYDAFVVRLEELLGLERLRCVHVNDSVGGLGSHRDRHQNVGEGALGLDPFRRLLEDPRLRSVPMIVETPRGEDRQGHVRDLAVLRSLVREA